MARAAELENVGGLAAEAACEDGSGDGREGRRGVAAVVVMLVWGRGGWDDGDVRELVVFGLAAVEER